jgi:cellulose synthase/poly-beta-1,6-N-acetylglucosamine synthase-like glycosyltransferase
MEDLLPCLVNQTYWNFEVIIIESGSEIKSDQVVEKFADRLNIKYFYKNNEGQGFSRNYGMERAAGDYLVILDSDILMDSDYLENLNKHLQKDYLDAFGGPDRAHPSFSPTQKAIDYILTSFITTGGIRGNKKQVDKFYPRSFNMGFSKEVYEKTKGYKYPFFGEDIELSTRIMNLGFKTGLIPEAYVYHKRKNSLKGFYKQMHWTGRSRINIYKMFPDSLKLVHMVPALFLCYWFFLLVVLILSPLLALVLAMPFIFMLLLIFSGSLIKYMSLKISGLAVAAFFVQIAGYGSGFLRDVWNRIILKKEAFCYDNKFIFKSVK